MTWALTTNDVRVLELLVDRGELTEHEICCELSHGFGWEAAQRRLAPLRARRLIVCGARRRGLVYDATPLGKSALLSAEVAAYGRFV